LTIENRQTHYSPYISISISMIFFPAVATLVPGPKMAATPEEYLYSSATDYAGEKGLVVIEFV
jgi:hypothetical protein